MRPSGTAPEIRNWEEETEEGRAWVQASNLAFVKQKLHARQRFRKSKLCILDFIQGVESAKNFWAAGKSLQDRGEPEVHRARIPSSYGRGFKAAMYLIKQDPWNVANIIPWPGNGEDELYNRVVESLIAKYPGEFTDEGFYENEQA